MREARPLLGRQPHNLSIIHSHGVRAALVVAVLPVHDGPHELLVVDVAVAVLVPGQQLLNLEKMPL